MRTYEHAGAALQRLLDAVMDGALDELIDALVTADQAEKLKNGAQTPDEER